MLHALPGSRMFDEDAMMGAEAGIETAGAEQRSALIAGLRRFGHDRFRPGQQGLVEAVLAGPGALGTVAPGGGESPPFNLAAPPPPRGTGVGMPLLALLSDSGEGGV